MAAPSGDTLLHNAARNGNGSAVKVLLETKAEIDKQNKDGDTPLLCALSGGHVAAAKILIDAKADPNTENETGYTPLYFSLLHTSQELMTTLMEAKADINKVTKKGDTATLWSTLFAFPEAMQTLLESKAIIDRPNQAGDTELLQASQEGATEILELLIQAKADLNKTNPAGECGLLLAAKNGYDDVVKILIDAKSDVNKSAKDGSYPLLMALRTGNKEVVSLLMEAKAGAQDEKTGGGLLIAAREGKADVVKLLLDTKAEVNKQNDQGECAITEGARSGSVGVVQICIDAKCDVDLANKQGETALTLAMSLTNATAAAELLKVLIKANANVNKQNNAGETALLLALRGDKPNPAIWKPLLEAKANPDLQNKSSNTALIMASRFGSAGLELVTSLLSLGANVNIARSDGVSAIIMALREGNVDVVTRLADAKADVNQTSKAHEFPLEMEGKKKGANLLLIKKLIECKANLDRQNQVGDTLLHQATRVGNVELVKILVEAHANVDIQNQSSAPALREAKGRRELVNAIAKGATPNTLVWAVQYGKEMGGDKFLSQSILEIKDFVNSPTTVKLDKIKLGTTPLIAATGQRDLMAFLLSKKADPNLKDAAKTPPLIYAVRSGKKECVAILIENKADVDEPDAASNTAVITAVYAGGTTWDASIVKLLVEAKANVNKLNQHQEAALHYARRKDVAQLLIDNGAELIVYNKVGYTAVEKATEGKAPDVADLLRENIGIAQIRVADQMRFLLRGSEIEPPPSTKVSEGDVLGSGGAGQVYKAKWAGTQVAVKKLHELTPKTKKELIQEALFMQTISHPNIVRLFGVCVEPTNECIVMELCEAGSFYHFLAKNIEITWADGLRKLMNAAAAMLFLHNRQPPVIHRDLKALNILLHSNGSALLSDLGLASIASDLQEVAGSYPWMAPEIHDGKRASRASDVYAFGMVLYEVRSRQAPYWDVSAEDWKRFGELVKEGRRPTLHEDPNAPDGYDDLMKKCWSENPDDRPDFPTIYDTLESLYNQTLEKSPGGTITGALQKASVMSVPIGATTVGPGYLPHGATTVLSPGGHLALTTMGASLPVGLTTTISPGGSSPSPSLLTTVSAMPSLLTTVSALPFVLTTVGPKARRGSRVLEPVRPIEPIMETDSPTGEPTSISISMPTFGEGDEEPASTPAEESPSK